MSEARVTGAEDPVDEVPWAMPLAFVVDKQSPATVVAILEASAKAVVSLLADERALSGEWKTLVERWTDGRIRKVVRRGKPAVFERAAHLPGVTVHHRGATVRAFVPGATSPLHPNLNRMQVSGSEPPVRGESSKDVFLRVAVNPALAQSMSTGKAAAQVGHAAQLAWMHMSTSQRAAWQADDFSVGVLFPDAVEWVSLLNQAQESVVDAGFTEIPPGSNTVIALY